MRLQRPKVWICIVVGVLVLVGTILLGGQQPQPVFGEEGADRQIAVKLAESGDIAVFHATHGTSTVKQLASRVFVIEFPAGADPAQLRQNIANDPNVIYLESNQIGHAPEADGVDVWAWPANNPQAGPREAFEWSLSDGQGDNRGNRQLNIPSLNLDLAHVHTLGAGITVAILDTGIDPNHPNLTLAISPAAYDFVDNDANPMDEQNGLDEDGDGYIDEVAGHGTHIAGIVRTVAPEAAILPLRVLNSDGMGDSFTVAQAIWYAVENGADVINLSLSTVTPSSLLQDAVDGAIANGVVVVAAAGNTGRDVPQYPAAFDCVISVTSTNRGGLLEPYASYGEWVNIAAPGKRVLSSYLDGGYAWWSGTSMAAPLVTGQVALLKGYDTTLSIQEIGNLISATANNLDGRNADYTGLMGQGQIDIGTSVSNLATNTLLLEPPSLLPACN